ncbi:MAG: GNAT family N-acetyltransferase [Propionibacteriaceae bacterium]|jgi:predicted N-acetyltransferase YhbS|nr:GNAT family N-acetyltransferase [Propionibacteriaceae bacterium]
MQIRKLEKADDLEGFSSGAVDLDDWFVRFAWENQQANNAVTYVCVDDTGKVLGFYSVAMGGVGKASAPTKVGKNRPSIIPCVLLARLAVNKTSQGSGIGRKLLTDAFKRTVLLSTGIGAAVLLIHCRDEHARAFYTSLSEFQESPTDQMHLMITIKDIKRAAASADRG